MNNYKKSYSPGDLVGPENSPYRKQWDMQDMEKPEPFVPPKPPKPKFVFEKKITEFYRCPDDGFWTFFSTCDKKARYCGTNCTCNEVCRDTDCTANCRPDCCCDSYCSDCDNYRCGDRGCSWDEPGCMGHCLNDWD